MMGRLSIILTQLFHDQPHILGITLLEIKIKQLDGLKSEILVSQKKAVKKNTILIFILGSASVTLGFQ